VIFNSVTYLVFLAIVVTAYWVLPRRPRLWLLFLSGLVFYGFWRPEFVVLMIGSATVDYVAGRLIYASSSQVRRRALLALSVGTNLALLFYFKYLAFFAATANDLASVLGIDYTIPPLSIILPLGISFYTFQTISYTVDVYRGFIKPERDFIVYGSFVVYFPQLVAGPILRAAELIGQLSTRPKFDPGDVTYGLRRIAYGLFLKVVLADNVGPLVDAGFAEPTAALRALDVWTLAFLFGFQIYFDFSAYSHIALGSARMMGIRLPENFNFPYMASSPREFWQRWHISLSSWIRDYVYLPLMGAQVYDRSTGGIPTTPSGAKVSGAARTQALFGTWAIMGLWHGANWTFVVWGLYHATLIYVGRRLADVARRWPRWLIQLTGWGLTLVFVMLSWVPFRAQSLEQTFSMWAKVFTPTAYAGLGLRENYYLVAFLLTAGVATAYAFHGPLSEWLRRRSRPSIAITDTAAMGVVVALVFIFLRPVRQFIYFQF
jgi:D-alanyl-lipoteichoic acid acyltransferase DltB (MBOAT superfamily)